MKKLPPHSVVYHYTIAMSILGILHDFCHLLIFFKINLKKKRKKTAASSECHTVWIHIQCFVAPDLGPNCLPKLSADDSDRIKVNP